MQDGRVAGSQRSGLGNGGAAAGPAERELGKESREINWKERELGRREGGRDLEGGMERMRKDPFHLCHLPPATCQLLSVRPDGGDRFPRWPGGENNPEPGRYVLLVTSSMREQHLEP